MERLSAHSCACASAVRRQKPRLIFPKLGVKTQKNAHTSQDFAEERCRDQKISEIQTTSLPCQVKKGSGASNFRTESTVECDRCSHIPVPDGRVMGQNVVIWKSKLDRACQIRLPRYSHGQTTQSKVSAPSRRQQQNQQCVLFVNDCACVSQPYCL